MPWSKPEATEILRQLQLVSHEYLDRLGCQHEPYKPITRTRPWHVDGPVGMGYHWTGGPSWKKSIKWFNHAGWGNTVSSAHFLVLDRMPSNSFGDLWATNPLLFSIFPVPTIMLADPKWGTWCNNWANKYILGVENRCQGRTTRGKVNVLNKEAVVSNQGVVYEPFTRQQLICNIQLGRLFRSLRGQHWDPDWIVGHQGIWATKFDPGPTELFPIHDIRNAIFSNNDILRLDWLKRFAVAPKEHRSDHQIWWDHMQDCRGGTEKEQEVYAQVGEQVVFDNRHETVEYLNNLGFNVWPGCSNARLQKFVAWFQHSTRAYKKAGQPQHVLAIDGQPGPKTLAVLRHRMKDLKY